MTHEIQDKNQPDDKLFTMRVKPDFLAALDEVRSRERPIPSRAEMLRLLVRRNCDDAERENERLQQQIEDAREQEYMERKGLTK